MWSVLCDTSAPKLFTTGPTEPNSAPYSTDDPLYYRKVFRKWHSDILSAVSKVERTLSPVLISKDFSSCQGTIVKKYPVEVRYNIII